MTKTYSVSVVGIANQMINYLDKFLFLLMSISIVLIGIIAFVLNRKKHYSYAY